MSAALFRIEPATAHYRLGAALLKRGIIKVGVGARSEYFECERRWLGEVARHDANAAALKPAQELLQRIDIHRLFEAVAHRLIDERDDREPQARP